VCKQDKVVHVKMDGYQTLPVHVTHIVVTPTMIPAEIGASWRITHAKVLQVQLIGDIAAKVRLY
jgi:hypothetical protein